MNGPIPPVTSAVRSTEDPTGMEEAFEERLTDNGEMVPVTTRRRVFVVECPFLSVTVRLTE